jgi:lipid-binding SYLF domain-containing protein
MNSARRTVILSAAALSLAAALGSPPARAADASTAAALVRKAEGTINSFAQNRDLGDFRQALGQAKGVLIFPQIVKAAELIGGSAGKGVLLVRDEETGAWTGPVFYSMVSASLGLQVGASTTQTVLIVRTHKALQALYDGKVKRKIRNPAAAGLRDALN